jgi:carboxylesterase type B
MSNDQELMWDLLSARYARISHAWGQELAALSKKRNKKKFHAQADQRLSATLAWPVEDRARAVKTWLSTYRIPLNPAEMSSFGRFHKTTGSFVFDNCRSILAYEYTNVSTQ